MIFLSGVHGVGKSYFCRLAKEVTGIESYSASELIAQKRQIEFSQNKFIPDIEDNQPYLLQAVAELKATGQNFILDGHFCLLDGTGKVQRISRDTFITLMPESIILLTEKPEIIADRRRARDKVDVNESSIIDFQLRECNYAKELAENIGAQLFISGGSGDIANAIEFIKSL